MPLKSGTKQRTINRNISEQRKAGVPLKTATARALDKARDSATKLPRRK